VAGKSLSVLLGNAFSLQSLFGGVMNQKKGVNTIPYIKKEKKGFKFLHQMAPLSNKKLTSFLEIV